MADKNLENTKDVTPRSNGIIEQELMPMIATKSDPDTQNLIVVDDHIEILNYDSFVNKLDEIISKIDDYEYSEDDRKLIKKMRAATNKLSGYINDDVKQAKARRFDVVDEQRKELSTKFGVIASKLSKGLDASDARLRQEKEDAYKEAFNEMLKSYEITDIGLTYNMVALSSWLNRSANQSNAIKELTTRVSAVANLYKNRVVAIKDAQFIVDTLIDTDWDGLEALNKLVEEEERRQQEAERRAAEEEGRRIRKERRQKALAAQQEKSDSEALETANDNSEEAEVNKEKEENTVPVMITIKRTDWEKASSLLDAAGVHYEIA